MGLPGKCRRKGRGEKMLNEDAISRVQEMETILNGCRAELDALSAAIGRYADLLQEQRKLFRYYGSLEWHADREADEDGELPCNLPRGVLSEDAVYDLITDSIDTADRMQELSEEIRMGL